MKRIIIFGAGLFLMVEILLAQPSLPISRIHLYKNGMAYLVRAGNLQEPSSLSFHPNDMKDVLKTFTAWNPRNGSLYSLGYTTGIPLEQVLGQFPFTVNNAQGGLAGFLAQIQGAELSLTRGSGTREGRLVALTSEPRAVEPQTVVKDHLLSLLDSEGMVQTVWLSEVDSLRLKDPELSGQFRRYLETLAEGQQDVTREITVYPIPQAGPVQVAYVQQFPVWKTSYRIEISGSKADLQGWAQVDNPTGEAWEGIDLTLVSGMPVSFIMDLYQPLYTERAMVPVPGARIAAPRSYESAVRTRTQASSDSAVPAEESRPESRKAAIIAAREPGEGGFESIALAPAQPVFSQAETGQVQDYFEYRFPFRVRLQARQSALLPFLQKEMLVEQVSIYNPQSDDRHPLNGVWLENTTGVPLEAGPLTFFSEGRYGGEAVLQHLSRNERRLVSYGVDYDVQMSRQAKLEPETLVSLTINRGTLIFQRERVRTTLYQLRNKAKQEKVVLIEHPRHAGHEIKGSSPLEVTANHHRFQVRLESEEEVDFPVQEVLSRETSVAIGDLSRQQLHLSLSGRRLPQQLREELEAVMSTRERLSLLEGRRAEIQREIQAISQDQGRLRDNLSVLRNSEEERSLRQRYLDQLNQQEDRLQELSRQLPGLEEQLRALRQELSDRIGRISGSVDF